jgi:hypothetical protein
MADAVEWLTYTELADRLGLTRGSARNLVQRRRWARQIGNDGQARIGVPAEELAARTATGSAAGSNAGIATPPGAPPAPPSDAPNPVHLQLARLEGELAGLRELVQAERSRADAEARRAEGEAKRAEVEAARAASAEADRDAWRSLAQRSWWRRLVG